MGGGSFTSGRRTAFGQGKGMDDGHEDVWDKCRGREKIIYRLGNLLLSEHEKWFGSYWRQVFGPPSSLMHLLGKGLSVRDSNSLLFRVYGLGFRVYFCCGVVAQARKRPRKSRKDSYMYMYYVYIYVYFQVTILPSNHA
jgi:hypothetical protein